MVFSEGDGGKWLFGWGYLILNPNPKLMLWRFISASLYDLQFQYLNFEKIYTIRIR